MKMFVDTLFRLVCCICGLSFFVDLSNAEEERGKEAFTLSEAQWNGIVSSFLASTNFDSVEASQVEPYSEANPDGKWPDRWIKSKISASSSITARLQFVDLKKEGEKYPSFRTKVEFKDDQIVVQKELTRDPMLRGGIKLGSSAGKIKKFFIEGMDKTGLVVFHSSSGDSQYKFLLLCPRSFISGTNRDGKAERNLKDTGHRVTGVSFTPSASLSGVLETGSIKKGHGLAWIDLSKNIVLAKQSKDESVGPSVAVDLDYVPQVSPKEVDFSDVAHSPELGVIRSVVELELERVKQISFSESSMQVKQVDLDHEFIVPAWGAGFPAQAGGCAAIVFRGIKYEGFLGGE